MTDNDPVWRPMRREDLPEVNRIAELVHPDFPESADIPAERLRLYPQGCLVLQGHGGVVGYAISHPWHAGQPPALDSLLGAIPPDANLLYLHDLALLPQARNSGAAGRAVAHLVARAASEGLAVVMLVAVNRSTGFWERQGFHSIGAGPASYGADARIMTR